MEAETAIAWTLHNRRIASPNQDYRSIISEGYTKWMSGEFDKFYATDDFLATHDTWEGLGEGSVGKGKSTMESWQHCLALAQALVDSGAETEAFEKCYANPFVGNIDNPYAVIQYVGFRAASEPTHYKIGNSWFKRPK